MVLYAKIYLSNEVSTVEGEVLWEAQLVVHYVAEEFISIRE